LLLVSCSFLAQHIFHHEYGVRRFLRNAGEHLSDNMALYPRCIRYYWVLYFVHRPVFYEGESVNR
jgi:hypothetical protein